MPGLPPGITLREKDAPILPAAMAARATHLVTGDFRDFGSYFGRRLAGVLVTTPADHFAADVGEQGPASGSSEANRSKRMTRLDARSIATSLLVVSLPAFAVDPPVVLLWPHGAPGSEGRSEPEQAKSAPTMPIQVTSVHKPSLIVYLPAKETATGAAVVVIPGGGHRMLVMEHEGYAVARWLSERGIAAFILKYRLAREEGSTYQIETHALGDTQRAIRLVRHRASEWGVDPRRVGVLGFSAGGELAALSSYREPVLTNPDDPIDRTSSRPDFQALLYPAIPNDMKPAKDTPPAFLACGFGDRQNISEGLPSLYLLFKQAGVPTDLHVYAGAGHGFGIRESNKSPAGAWPERFREWLEDRGFLARK